jgi:hypothetical protein
MQSWSMQAAAASSPTEQKPAIHFTPLRAPKEQTMKFRDTVFFRELLAVILGSGLLIASFTFVAVPYSLGPANVVLHLT